MFRRREKMKRNGLIVGVPCWYFVSASAETVVTGHEAAIKACSTVNPSQPVSALNAVDDGTGIGFSLVWLNDKGRQSVDVRRRRRWQRLCLLDFDR
jgi:hypothetical protein